MSLEIERASNGYVLRDAAGDGTHLVADPDPLRATHALLLAVLERIGTGEDGRREITVRLAPHRRLRAEDPRACRHDGPLEWIAYRDEGVHCCPCGQRFVAAEPDTEPAEG